MTPRVLALLLSSALIGSAAFVHAAGPAAERPAASVETVLSEARPYAERIILRGRTEADRRVAVRAEISGLVAEQPPQRGAVVAAGDPLCVLDPGDRPASLAQAQAMVRQTEAEYEAARRLREKGFTAETESLTRAAALEQARAMLMKAEIDMARLTIAAPFAGVIEDETAELGALLQVGDVCATVVALDPLLLVGYASERDVDRLTVGAEATATLVSGRDAAGSVRFVSRVADEATRTYRVEVAVPNPDLSLRDGMTAEIEIPVEGAAAHLLPQSALTLDDAGRLGVRVVADGAALFVPVAILNDSPSGVWLSGLPQTSEVIVTGQEYVSDGHPVTPTRREGVE